jgi:hypothetical protein
MFQKPLVSLVALAIAAFVGYGTGCSSSPSGTGDYDGGAVGEGGTNNNGDDDGGGVIPEGDAGTMLDQIGQCIDAPQRFPYKEPFDHANLCTPVQLETYSQCFHDGDLNRCKNFKTDAANKDCLNGCLESFGGQVPKYGPILITVEGNGFFFNERGYFTLNGVSDNCRERAWDVFSCVAFSCAPCIDTSDQVYEACLGYASDPGGGSKCVDMINNQTGACSGEVSKVNALRADEDTRAGVLKMLTRFCGAP